MAGEPLGYEVAILAVVGAGLTLYVLLGGADFGGGVWDLLASGPLRERQRGLISEALAPVWEANHVWLIFALVGLLAGFPSAFAAVGIALYLPFTLALVGIVFRGAAFTFRSYGEAGSGWQLWTPVFGVASLVTPVVLGAAGASIGGGRIRIENSVVSAGLVGSWTGPLSIAAGALTLVFCAYLAATYLTVEALHRDDAELEDLFRRRALGAGVVAGGLAALGLLVMRFDAQRLWEGMLDRGWPLILLSAAGGLGSIAAMYGRRYYLARFAAAAAVGSVLVGWGLAQWPYLIVPDLKVAEAAAPPATLRLVTWAFAIGGALLLPSILVLFRVFKASHDSAGASPERAGDRP